MAYYKTKIRREQALRAAMRQLPNGCLATPTLCHDWTGVVDLSPYFFYKYRQKRAEQMGGGKKERKMRMNKGRIGKNKEEGNK
jgi:hypothetical protein